MARPTRVLFAIGSMGGGGSERQVAAILRRLDRSRFAPLLYLTSPVGEFLSELPDDTPVFSFWNHRAAPRFYLPGRIHRQQVRHLAQVLVEQQVDVICDRTYFMTLVAAAAARRRRTTRVSFVVSDPRLELTHANERFRLAKKWLLRKAYRTADRVAAVSEAVRAAAMAYYGLPPERVASVPSFVDIARIDRLAEATGAEFAPDRFHIVTAGRLHVAKGHGYLLQAVEELVHRRGRRRLLLHVFGQGPLESKLKAFVRERGLQDHVRFEGFALNPFPAFRSAQLFCLPSLYDGMPNALLEAMACGAPVLAADCPGGVREILDEGRCGRLAPPADAAALADAIEDAAAQREHWQAAAAAARARVCQLFSPEAGMARVERVLSEACGGRG